MYREKVSWPLWIHFVFVLIVVFLAAMALKAAFGSEAIWVSLLMFGVAIAVAIASWRLRHVQLEVGPDQVAFGFGGIGRRIPRDRVDSLEVETYAFTRYMGWGYRFGWKPRDRAYSILGYRRGVRIRFRDEIGREWQVFVSSADPDTACKAFVGADS